jgi:hypothetical protein
MDASIPHAPASAGVTSQTANPATRRIIAAAVAVACTGILGVALALSPADRGLGTHEQLNLPPCGWIAMMDLPCMTCGMTTSFSHAVRGQFLASLLAQPLGFLLAMATAMTMLVSMQVTVTGSNLPMFFSRMWNRSMFWLVGIVFLAAWFFKIASYRGLI